MYLLVNQIYSVTSCGPLRMILLREVNYAKKKLEDNNQVFDRSAEKFVLENIEQNDTLEI